MNAIECHHLTRTFGRTRAVDDLNLVVPVGSVFALLGANGAGKSTTLKLLLNLLRPTSGSATVLGCVSTAMKKEMFRRIHQTLRVTPAMAAKVSNRLWELADIVALIESPEASNAEAA